MSQVEVTLDPGKPCPFCEEDFLVEVYDYDVAERWFLFNTCCEASFHEQVYQMHFWSQHEFRDWFYDQTGIVIRGCWVNEPVADLDRFNATLDYGLKLEPIKLAEANAFLETHHRHNGRINQFKIGAGIWNGPDLIGLVTVEPPRARMLENRAQALEVTRVCIRSDIEPRELVANACSMAYGYACREARKRGYLKVITYTRSDESGGSVKSAGFTAVYTQPRAGKWDRSARPRSEPKSKPVPKTRWERLVA